MKKFKSIPFYFATAALALILSGCSLNIWDTDNYCDGYNKSKYPREILVKADVLTTKKECKAALGKGGKYILGSKRKRIYPIEVTIENKSKKTWKLEKRNIELKTADPKIVTKRMQRRPLVQAFFSSIAAGIKYVAFAFFGGLILGGIEASTESPVFTAIVAIPFWIIQMVLGFKLRMASTEGYVKAAISNKEIENKIDDLSVFQDIVLQPLEKKIFFLFVKKQDYKDKFGITFTDRDNNEKRFIVPLY